MEPLKPPQPSAAPIARADQTKASPKALALVMGTACAALCLPFVSGWENGPKGPALVPYRDIVGVWTQCSGETLHVTATSPKETAAGCAIKLDTRLAGFARGVAARNPQLRGHDERWAAATSLAYNIGVTAYNGSTVARRFSAGDVRGACDAFLMWDKAKGVRVQGLVNRRAAERALCRSSL